MVVRFALGPVCYVAAMLAAAYVRVSSRGQNLATQRSAIERAARARRDRIGCWYSEKLSTATQRRPQLDRLRNDVRAGRVTRVYVYRLDRLSRGGIRETLSLVNELQHGGCELETIADGFSLGGPGGEIVLAVFAWAAQMERAAIGERVAAARVRVEASGGHWGRPRRVDDALAIKVRKLKAQGRSERSIAMALKIPRSTVHRVLVQKGTYKRKLATPTKTAVKSRAARVVQ